MPRYKKCPRCELNYIPEDREYCDVCEQEMRGIEPGYTEEEPVLCAKCHQNVCEIGEEYCSECLREKIAEGEQVDNSELMPGATITSFDELTDNEWADSADDVFDDNDSFGNSADSLDDNIEENFGADDYDTKDYVEDAQSEETSSYEDSLLGLDDEYGDEEEEDEEEDDDDFDFFGEKEN